MTAQSLNILLVDDHPFMQKVVNQLIVSSGFTSVEICGSGTDALDRLRKDRFQLMITDLDMQPVDGYDLVREVRMGSTRNDRDLPILVMTGHTEAELVTRCLMLDINGFIMKPVEQEEMTKKIISAFARKIRLKSIGEYRQVATQWDKFARAKDPSDIQNQTLQSLENAHQFLTTTIPVGANGLVKAPLPLSFLEKGMTVAEEVLTKNDSVLLKEGLVLSERALTVLNKNKENLCSQIISVFMEVGRFKLLTELQGNGS